MNPSANPVACPADACRYCRAASDYLHVPPGHPDACQAAQWAAQAGEVAAFDLLRSLSEIPRQGDETP